MDRAERFTVIFREQHPKIAAYARRRAGPDVAQEVVADTFLAAWRHIDRLPDDPLPWLYRAAALALANRRRQTARDTRLVQRVLGAPQPRASDVADIVVSASAWSQALSALSEREREVLLLAAWEGLTPAQAAASLQCSAVAYRVRLHRARRHLGAVLRTGSPPAHPERPAAGSPPAPPAAAQADRLPGTATPSRTVSLEEV